jgi:hypothetical protein
MQSHYQIGLPIFPVVTDFSTCKEYAANIVSQIETLEMSHPRRELSLLSLPQEPQIIISSSKKMQ